MAIYLVQHGKATSEEVDPSRPLTMEGREETERVATYLVGLGIKVGKIIHSTKLRARQTAEILANYLRPSEGIEEVKDLEPRADPRVWYEKLKDLEGDLMVVGHLPHLSRLASLLITGRDDVEAVKFRYSGVVKLVRDGGKWLIDWVIKPEVLK